MNRARVLLVDDHDLFREGLASLIEAQADLAVVGQTGDGLEALTLARDLQPDLILMDINMPVCDGLEATRLIHAAWPDIRIVMLTVHDEDQRLFEAIKSGAVGYLLKSSGAAEFLAKLRSVLAGEAVLPAKLVPALLDEFARLARLPASPEPPAEPTELTAREREVLRLIAGGATDREIAANLSLSLHTVKSHVRNILTKLHAVNRRHAANLARQEGWLDKRPT